MSREVRRVHKDWVHPYEFRDNSSRAGPVITLIPLFANFAKSLASWENARDEFEAKRPWLANCSFEEWYGERPIESDYMPEWPEAERTHLQMYETVTEGSPISPVMETPEELARWLADNKASACGSGGATYDDWLAMIKVGWAPTAIGNATGIHGGVEAIGSMSRMRARQGGEDSDDSQPSVSFNGVPLVPTFEHTVDE
jgi:hypothetical protein